jgi:hypothetical protein
MAKILRFIGTINAAVWLGSAVFVTIGLPVVFSPEIGRYIQRPLVGVVAETILARFAVVQYCCAAIAVITMLAEYVFVGRRVSRSVLAILLGLTAVALVSGMWVQPKMRRLHYTKYWGTVTSDREEADKSFRRFHGASQGVNLLVISALVIYVWRVTERPNDGEGKPRFSTLSKIQS